MRRVLSRNQRTGAVDVAHISDMGEVTVETAQNVEPVLSRNRQDQASPDTQKGRDMWRVASIPAVVVVKWLNDYGINLYNDDHLPEVMKLLNKPEWKYLRTLECNI